MKNLAVKNLSQVSTETLAKRVLKLKEKTEPIYAEIDRLGQEILARCTLSTGRRSGVFHEVEIKHKGELYRLVDNFEGKNVVYRPARVSRFELQRVPRPKPIRAKNPRKVKP